MHKLAFILFASMLFIGCSRKTALQKSYIKDKGVEVTKSTDSSFTTVQTNSKQYVNYGDTLQGSVTAVDSVTTDSIESNGVKTTVTVIKQKNGSTKVNLKSVAKPKQQVNETQTTAVEQKHIATIDSIKKDLVTETKDKQVESGASLKTYAIVFISIGIIGLIIYIVGQYKKWW